VVGRVSKAEVESKVFPVLLYYPELSLTHVHSLVTAVVYNTADVSATDDNATDYKIKNNLVACVLCLIIETFHYQSPFKGKQFFVSFYYLGLIIVIV